MDSSTIYNSVQEHYSTIAKGSANGADQNIAKHFGYEADDLNTIPAESNLGLSCGNPLAIATLKPGEIVIDLGSGAGFDVFQAARKVGCDGEAVGVDQNDVALPIYDAHFGSNREQDMLARANKNKEQARIDNARFVRSAITSIDLPSAYAECVISNCVINLVPENDKPLVFKEMFRLLKPGGRVAISDILAKKTLPEHIRRDMALYVGCIAGASQLEQYDTYLRDAGFIDIMISDTNKSINVYKEADQTCQSCCESCCVEAGQDSEVDFDEWAGSFRIFASKPMLE